MGGGDGPYRRLVSMQRSWSSEMQAACYKCGNLVASSSITSVFLVCYWYCTDIVAYLRPLAVSVVLVWNGGMVDEL